MWTPISKFFLNDACHASEVRYIEKDAERWSGGKDTVNAISRALGLVNLYFICSIRLVGEVKKETIDFLLVRFVFCRFENTLLHFILCFCNICWFHIILMVILIYWKFHLKFWFDCKMCDLCFWPKAGLYGCLLIQWSPCLPPSEDTLNLFQKLNYGWIV